MLDEVKLPPRTIALLGDVGDPEVATYGRYSLATSAHAYRRQMSPLHPVETVTKMMLKLLELGLVKHGPRERPSVEASYPMELTDTGRAYLESLT